MQRFPIFPHEIVVIFFKYREMILMLIRRDIASRYRGSMVGIFWPILLPLFMLIINTFVYSVIFKSKWNADGETTETFALILFAGTLVFSVFSECMNRACTIIIANTNYVKKVIFPLEILPCVLVGSSLFHLFVGLSIWLIFYFIISGVPHWTIIYFPLLLIPFIAFLLGISWFLSAIGVYVRDTAHAMSVIISITMGVTPIFYPLSAVPAAYRSFFYINPLVFVMEQTRNILIWGKSPSMHGLLLFSIISFTCAWLGFVCFQKMRRGFSDVI